MNGHGWIDAMSVHLDRAEAQRERRIAGECLLGDRVWGFCSAAGEGAEGGRQTHGVEVGSHIHGEFLPVRALVRVLRRETRSASRVPARLLDGSSTRSTERTSDGL